MSDCCINNFKQKQKDNTLFKKNCKPLAFSSKIKKKKKIYDKLFINSAINTKYPNKQRLQMNFASIELWFITYTQTGHLSSDNNETTIYDDHYFTKYFKIISNCFIVKDIYFCII